MHLLADYGLFLAKTLTFVAALLILTFGMIALFAKSKSERQTGLSITKLNKKYENMEKSLKKEIFSKKEFKAFEKQLSKDKKNQEQTRRKIYVLRFNGDIRASGVEELREEITAVLNVAAVTDEIVVCLESPGGMVPHYGLGASQLQRIKDKRIPLTICIDKVAASGGYLMASVADKILAAPFSMIGSIGVIAQLPNFHEWLQKRGIGVEQVMAGKYKRTLTIFGENTDKAREKMKEDLEEIHDYFKTFIASHRPDVNIEDVSTGEHWLGVKALELKLVDECRTSDDYLFSAYRTADIFEISYEKKRRLSEKLFQFAEEKLGFLTQVFL